MEKGRVIISLVCIAFLGYITHSCANIVRPNGGERDQTGPQVETFLPANGTLNFAEKQIVIKFDEYLKEGSYGDQVFISPVPDKAPEVLVRNKEMLIRFRSPLMENTTYVVSIGKGVKDFNEGNEMTTALTYAFSTGDQLDSLYFRGTVQNGWTGAAPKKLRLLLFPADSVPDNNFRDKRPLYVAEADEQTGAFSFLYLRNQSYKVFGVEDGDNSYSYNSNAEPIALIADPSVNLTDTAFQKKVFLLESFLPDNKGPEVRSAKVLHKRSIHVELKEKIRPAFNGDSLRITLSDTFGNQSREITGKYYLFQSEMDLLLDAQLEDSIPMLLKFEHFYDSLGNRADTTVLILPQSKSALNDGIPLNAPKFDVEKQRIYLESMKPMDEFENWEAYFQILDTGKVALPLKAIFTSPFSVSFEFAEQPNPKMQYKIAVKKGFPFRESQLTDSLPPLKVSFPAKESFGSLIGKVIPDSTDPADMQYIVCLLTQSKRGGFGVIRRTTGERNFKFDWLEPGKYRVVVIKDADKNGYWTPGSLSPYRMPEQVYRDPETLDIKANWDLEGYTVTPIKQKGTIGGKGKGSKTGGKGNDESPGPDKPKGDDK